MTGRNPSDPLSLLASLTVGEQIVGRELAKEYRAGVEHYVPGQYAATLVSAAEYGTKRPVEVGRITYVDVMGHACVVLTMRHLDEPGEWVATWVSRAGQAWKSEARKVEPGEFTLSEKMLAALAAGTPHDMREDDVRG